MLLKGVAFNMVHLPLVSWCVHSNIRLPENTGQNASIFFILDTTIGLLFFNKNSKTKIEMEFNTVLALSI